MIGMDLRYFVNKVIGVFYREFDYTDDTYYWVYEVRDDNTLIVQDGKTERFYLLNFTYEEPADHSRARLIVNLDGKDKWQAVESTYVPAVERSEVYTDEMRSLKIAELNRRTTTDPGNSEKRSFQRNDFSFDAENRKLSGYGVVFDSDSHPLRVRHNNQEIVVIERITADSVRDALMEDVVSAHNHNLDIIYGRTTAGTMRLVQDQRGIRYELDLANTNAANDLLANVRRGEITGSSFMFNVDPEAGYDIQRRDDGTLIAIPQKITRIMEMGPVVFPAYPETTAENRSALGAAIKEYLERSDAPRTDTKGQVSDDKMRHLEAKFRHNEEAAA